MTEKTYKTAVGAFVVLAIVLLVAGIVVLGGGLLFTNSLEYVLYFDGSVSGLSIGAPVVFRGVPMGNVTKISLVANSRDSNVTIPVTIRIGDHSFIRPDGGGISEKMEAQIIRRMIERGLRARLAMASLITGQYRVELDFFPQSPMNFRSSDPDSEIPTVPSPIDTLQKTLARIPIDQIADSLTTILASVTNAVGDGKLEDSLNAFRGAFAKLEQILDESDVSSLLKSAFTQLDEAAGAVRKDVPDALEAFTNAMNSLSRAAEGLRRVSGSAETALAPDSVTMNDLRRLLREASAAARSLRNFADMLERNPEALLMGRQGKR